MGLQRSHVWVFHPHAPDQEETRLPLDSLGAAPQRGGNGAAALRGVCLTAGAGSAPRLAVNGADSHVAIAELVAHQEFAFAVGRATVRPQRRCERTPFTRGCKGELRRVRRSYLSVGVRPLPGCVAPKPRAKAEGSGVENPRGDHRHLGPQRHSWPAQARCAVPSTTALTGSTTNRARQQLRRRL